MNSSESVSILFNVLFFIGFPSLFVFFSNFIINRTIAIIIFVFHLKGTFIGHCTTWKYLGL